jgi:hypothetical protein
MMRGAMYIISGFRASVMKIFNVLSTLAPVVTEDCHRLTNLLLSTTKYQRRTGQGKAVLFFLNSIRLPMGGRLCFLVDSVSFSLPSESTSLASPGCYSTLEKVQ